MLARFIKLSAVVLLTVMVINISHAEEKIDITKIMSERKIGRNDAPIKIEKYASFTCGHCANFEKNIMPQIKKEFVDKGIVQVIYKPFPLDEHSLAAEIMVRCAPENSFFNLYETLFTKQQDWFKSGDALNFLKNMGELAGLKKEKFNACINSKELAEALANQVRETYVKRNINAVPALVLNGEQAIIGYRDFEEVKKIIEDTQKILNLKKSK